MLWTDSLFVNSADLASVDAGIESTATDLGLSLDVTIKRGIESAGRFLGGKMVRFSTLVSSRDMSANHLAAVLNTGGGIGNNSRRATLEQVVVSGRNSDFWSELK